MANLLDKYIRMTTAYKVAGVIPKEHIDSLNARANIILDRYEKATEIKEDEVILDYYVNIAKLNGYRPPIVGESYQSYEDYIKSFTL